MANAIRTFGVPALNRGDLLRRCIESIDLPIEHLFVINNGEDQGVAETARLIETRGLRNSALFGNIRVERHKRLGVAPSWNRFITQSPGPWFIAANDIQLMPGALALADKVVHTTPDASVICADGYNIFMMTPLGVEKVGLFDENFYPAYFEDVDHFRRVRLSGAKAVNVPGFTFIHGEAPHWGSSTINSDPEMASKNKVTFANLREYYVRKWGGPPAGETFKTPFNRNVPLAFWALDSDLRRKNSLW